MKILFTLWSVVAALSLLRCGADPARKLSGTHDTTFGNAGNVIADWQGRDQRVRALALQSDGKIVVAGFHFNGTNEQFFVARFLEDGKLDETFGDQGFAAQDSSGLASFGTGVVVDSHDDIFVCGYVQDTTPRFAVAKFTSTGATRGVEVRGKGVANACRLDANGEIVLAGSIDEDFALSTSSLQLTSDAAGGARDFASALFLQDDGKALLVGSGDMGGVAKGIYAIRTDSSLTALDPGFDAAGTHAIGSMTKAEGNAIFAKGPHIFLAGLLPHENKHQLFVERLTENGQPDYSFGNSGMAFADLGEGEHRALGVVAQDDSVLAVGEANSQLGSSNFAIVRFDKHGKLDTSFNENGKVVFAIPTHSVNSARAVALQRDGKILVAGETLSPTRGFDIVISRLAP